MMQKKGFIATSLIYSFFLVFLILMSTILARAANNRILLNAIKGDIREELDNQKGFVVDTIENKQYQPKEKIEFASETWQVLQNKSNSVVVVLSRVLSQSEIVNAIGSERMSTEYLGTCNESSCQVRACREASAGQEFCYLYSGNNLLYLKPNWNPTSAEVNTGFGKTIVSAVTTEWFKHHAGLINVMKKNQLIQMSFSDGFKNHTSYVRLPLSGEVSNITDTNPYHLVDNPSSDGKKVRIFQGSSTILVPSNRAAFIRPVIEIKKGG